MTQRTILVGMTPLVIIKASGSVEVEGRDSDQVYAETHTRGGLKVESRSEAEIGRARAVMGDRLLFDVSLKLPGRGEKNGPGDAIEVQFGGAGKVRVPLGSQVKVYAGKDARVSDIQRMVAIYAGGDVRVRNVHSLSHVSAGGAIDLECGTIEGDEVKFEAGRDLRCYIRGLTNARVTVDDLGGAWVGVIGAGNVRLRLKAGGEVTLVTDQKVEAIPPDYILGQIESPASSSGATEPA